MKKLLSILFLLSSPAFAIDKPIPCEGASCKLKFETRDGSNVKVSAGEVSGSAWVLGSSAATTSAAVNEIKNGDGSNTNGTNTLTIKTGNQGAHAARLKIQNSTGGTTDIFEMTVGSGVTSFRNGAGVNMAVINNTNGAFKSVGTYIATNGAAIYRSTAAAATSCTTQCGSDDSVNGLNSSSGQCILAWNGSGGVDTCGGTTGTRYCFCAGLE
jgi:hypothetical protein